MMKTYEHTRCDTWMQVEVLEQDGWELISVVHYPHGLRHGDFIYFLKREIAAPVPGITTE